MLFTPQAVCVLFSLVVSSCVGKLVVGRACNKKNNLVWVISQKTQSWKMILRMLVGDIGVLSRGVTLI